MEDGSKKSHPKQKGRKRFGVGHQEKKCTSFFGQKGERRREKRRVGRSLKNKLLVVGKDRNQRAISHRIEMGTGERTRENLVTMPKTVNGLWRVTVLVTHHEQKKKVQPCVEERKRNVWSGASAQSRNGRKAHARSKKDSEGGGKWEVKGNRVSEPTSSH